MNRVKILIIFMAFETKHPIPYANNSSLVLNTIYTTHRITPFIYLHYLCFTHVLTVEQPVAPFVINVVVAESCFKQSTKHTWTSKSSRSNTKLSTFKSNPSLDAENSSYLTILDCCWLDVDNSSTFTMVDCCWLNVDKSSTFTMVDCCWLYLFLIDSCQKSGSRSWYSYVKYVACVI